MHFEYEIPVDEFVASQLLYYKLSGGRKRVERAVGWIIAGVACIFIAWINRSMEFTPILFAGIGVWWIYCGVANLLPARYVRRGYQKSDLAGKTYKADVNEDGFEVTGDMYAWRVRWPGVRLKGENERVIIFCAANTIFIFGKKYLNSEQQQELRRLSGLTPHAEPTPGRSE
jgi:hypothetical protein